MVTELMHTYGLQLLGALLIALFGGFGLLLRHLAAKYLDTDLKRSLARIAVQFVEQVYKQLHGEDKLNAALDVVFDLLEEKGITASEGEMKILLEAAVAEFNNAFARKTSPVAGAGQ